MKQTFLQQIFWDVDPKQLAQLDEEKIIARALTHGTLPVIQSIFVEYGKGRVEQVFFGMKKTSLDSRRYTYFEQLFS
jgi:hypothetical protein